MENRLLQLLPLQILLAQRLNELKHNVDAFQADFAPKTTQKEETSIAIFAHAPLLAPMPAWF
jgi:hypothetical protein